MSNKFEHFFASIYLAVVGDKIGFGNGDREKNYNHSIITDKDNTDYESLVEGLSLIMIFKFIEQGGITGLDMDLLFASDDTLMHSDTIQGFINPYSNKDELYNDIVKLINDYSVFLEEHIKYSYYFDIEYNNKIVIECMANSEHMDLLSSTTNSIMNMKNRLINLEKVLDKQNYNSLKDIISRRYRTYKNEINRYLTNNINT